MKVRLGYVALPLTISITSSKTITYTHFQQLSKLEKHQKLDQLITSNLFDLRKILLYNYKNHIHFFRITSKLLPLATHEKVTFSYYEPYRKQFQEVGKDIQRYQCRIDMHPDQFAVLNSDNEKVVLNTFQILKYHDRVLSMIGSTDGKLILHVGSSVGSKKEAMKRFQENFHRLPRRIQKRIVLENDDKVFDVQDVLALCQSLKIPMVLDYHHFLCNNKEEFIEDYLTLIFDTWKGTGLVPKIHFSSPKNQTKKDMRSHSEYLDGKQFVQFLTKLKTIDQDVDIMLEAKGKDRALFDLVRQLKYLENYTFIDESTFIM